MLDVNDLTVHFHGSSRDAVGGISLHMDYGERMGLVGESGSGKTVTAMAVSGLIQRNSCELSGKILFDGTDILSCPRKDLRSIQGSKIGVVFQEPMTSLNPLIRVGKQVEEALAIHSKLPPEERKQLALSAMEKCGIPDVEKTYEKYPHQLSGGQRQRAIIASAALVHPKLLICDEPTTALDVTVQAQILDLLKRLNEENGVAILMISHDLSVVRRICNRVAVMKRGKIVEVGDVEQIFKNPQHEYTKELIAAIPTRRKHDE